MKLLKLLACVVGAVGTVLDGLLHSALSDLANVAVVDVSPFLGEATVAVYFFRLDLKPKSLRPFCRDFTPLNIIVFTGGDESFATCTIYSAKGSYSFQAKAP